MRSRVRSTITADAVPAGATVHARGTVLAQGTILARRTVLARKTIPARKTFIARRTALARGAVLAWGAVLARGTVLAGVAVFVAVAATSCATPSSPVTTARPSAAAPVSPQRGTGRSTPGLGPVTPTGAVPPTGAAPVTGPVTPTDPAAPCPGWTTAPASALPASFTPVSVLRCVTGITAVPGKGEQRTATVERASNQDLTPLDQALRAAPGQRQAGQACPMFRALPPQIVLVGADGTRIHPRFPVTGCGQIQPRVIAALNALRWQTVSRTLVAPANQ